jgi:HlyD family secretion protein
MASDTQLTPDPAQVNPADSKDPLIGIEATPDQQLQPPEHRPVGSGKPRRRTTLPRSTRVWSRSIVWSLMGLTGFGVIYGLLARIDSSITATGNITVMKGVRDVSAPFNALVDSTFVRNGDRVKAGQPLLALRDRPLIEQQRQVELQAAMWAKEVNVLALQLGLAAPNPGDPVAIRQLSTARQEVLLREQAAESERRRGLIQIGQQQTDLEGLATRIQINRDLLNRMIPLQNAGAMSRMEIDRQRERLVEVETAYKRTQAEKKAVGEIVEQASSKVQQIPVADRREVFAQYDNARQQLIEAQTRIKGLQDQLRLSRIKAPIAGTIYDMSVAAGEIAGPGKPVLRIVPDGHLEADIVISSRDVGFLHPGQSVEVRIDSFPFTDYGAIKGKLKRISADALPADATHAQPYFSATVALADSRLQRQGVAYPLKPGMSLTALIQSGSRPVIAMISDRFIQFTDSPRSIR